MEVCKNTTEQSTRIPLWIACEEVAAPLGFRRQIVLYLWLLLLLLYKRKSQVQLADVAPMARRQHKLLEESEAVRPQEKKATMVIAIVSNGDKARHCRDWQTIASRKWYSFV